MNNSERVRKLALQSESNVWIALLGGLGLEIMILLSDRDMTQFMCLFVGFMLLCIIVSQGRSLAQEIVRLEEKIEELERRIH